MNAASYKKNNPNLRQPKMQHIRHVKPEFYVHDGVNNMSVNARYAETGTWTCCDKHGRFEWKPRTLKRLVMPYDDLDFESLMNEWLAQGFVQKYEVNGVTYGQFNNWEKHQGINLREKQSGFEHPAPPTGASTDFAHADTCLHVHTRVVSEGKGEGKSKVERKRKGQGQGSRASHAPDIAAPNVTTASKGTVAEPNTFISPDLTSTDKDRDTEAAGNEDQARHVWDIPTDSLDDMLFALTDGIFEAGALENYGEIIPDLKIACNQAIEKFGAVPLTDRSALSTVLNDVMTTMAQAGMRWPPGLLKAKKVLEAGGALQMPHLLKREAPIVHGDVFDSGSVLCFSSKWRAALLPYKELLQRIADGKAQHQLFGGVGVPQDWTQGIVLLESAAEELQFHNEPVPIVFADIQEQMQAKLPVKLPRIR